MYLGPDLGSEVVLLLESAIVINLATHMKAMGSSMLLNHGERIVWYAELLL